MNQTGIRSIALSLLSGVVISRLLQPLLFPVHTGVLAVSFGQLSFLVVVFSATWLFAGHRSRLLWISLGASLDQMVYLIIQEQGYGYYSASSLVGSLVFTSLFLLLAVLLYHREADIREEKTGDVWSFLLLSGTAVLVFRALHVMMVLLGIPNEERSSFLFGFEIHHINYGLLIAAIAALSVTLGKRFTRTVRIAHAALAFGIGMMIDQISYYALQDVSDEAYMSLISILGALSVLVLCVGLFWFKDRRLIF